VGVVVVAELTPEQMQAAADEQYARSRRAQENYDRDLAARSRQYPPGFPHGSRSLTIRQAEEPPVREYAIESIAGKGHLVVCPSSRKTGKTTMIANLAYCGVEKQDFLGRFGTHLDESACVGIWNFEMEAEDYTGAVAQLPLSQQGSDRIYIQDLKGYSVPFLADDESAAATVAWLRNYKIAWWFLDPWKNVLSANHVGMNDNPAVQDLVQRITEISKYAGVEMTWIPVHTPQSSGGNEEERAKGAGELEDAADSLVRYVRQRGGGRTVARTLTVEGRGGVGLDRSVIEFDDATGLLSIGDAVDHGRVEVIRGDASTDALVQQVTAAALRGERINTTQAQQAARVGHNAGELLRRASDRVHRVRDGHSWFWLPGDANSGAVLPPAPEGVAGNRMAPPNRGNRMAPPNRGDEDMREGGGF
jgi:hypothetical protein